MDIPSLLETDKASVWHPFSSELAQAPVVLTRAKGSYVWDSQGRRYLDTTSSWWCHIHGHCHDNLVRAMTEQAGQMDQVLFSPHTHEPGVRLAQNLLLATGRQFSKVFFSDNGSTSVETALKLALQYQQIVGSPSKARLMSLEGGYHGDTLGACSVGAIDEYFEPFRQTVHTSIKLPSPHYFKQRLAGESREDFFKRISKQAVHIIEAHHQEVAAFIVEPLIQGAAGMVVYDSSYLKAIIEACKAHGILVIFDEVFTGFGRTGSLFAMEQVEGEIDFLCLAKGLTSGMFPLSATLIGEKIFEAFQSTQSVFYHGHTFCGNPVGCAVGLESLRLAERGQKQGSNLEVIQTMSRWKTEMEKYDFVGEVRHLGMVWAMELVDPKNPLEMFVPPNGPGWKIAAKMWERGFWMRPLHQMLYFVPPYCVTALEADSFFLALKQESERVFSGLR